MAQAYVPIQTVTVGSGGTSTIDFTNIPQTYTDLMILVSTRTNRNSTGDYTALKFNGLTTNQSLRTLYAFNTTAGSNTDTSIYGYTNGNTTTASTFSNLTFYIPNYTSSTTNKSVSVDAVQEDNGTNNFLALHAGLWSSTAAITQVTLYPLVGTLFLQHSTATLYGIGGARASGGTITADARYTYHTFTSTGTFTANEKIKGAEILCIAGGGAGGWRGGGGGGGGVVYGFGLTLSAGGSSTVVIGAGGTAPANSSSNGTNGNNSSFGSFTAFGGGFGGSGTGNSGTQRNGNNGGSGGGSGTGSNAAATSTQTSFTNAVIYGNSGGTNNAGGGQDTGAGGGGAGAAGTNGTTTTAGNGGDGVSAFSAWGYATSTGQNLSGIYYYAGGAGGSGNSVYGIGGIGGGGAGGNAAAGTAGTSNTGGGGGGGANSYAGGAGGSGLVIIRYLN